MIAEITSLNKPFVEHALKWKFKIEAWVANDSEIAERIASLGIHAIASDRPDVLAKL